VCRDYAHLAIAFCRCLNIPARYCTGYLGDIGIPPPYGPMDLAAWFEAYIGGYWHTFDPRNNIPRIGRVLIARGRDATDVPISNTFGPSTLAGFRVWTDEVKRPLEKWDSAIRPVRHASFDRASRHDLPIFGAREIR
jgi:transglutaminase-like putative cysteine protease